MGYGPGVSEEVAAFLEQQQQQQVVLPPRSSSGSRLEELLEELPEDPVVAWERAYGILLPDVLRVVQACLERAVRSREARDLRDALVAVREISDRVLGRAAQRVEVESDGHYVFSSMEELLARKAELVALRELGASTVDGEAVEV